MNYKPNTIQWRPGSVVIHDVDAKEPRMLMRVVDYDKYGLARCVYALESHRKRPEIYANRIASLHDPAQFGLFRVWGDWSKDRLEDIQDEWDWARRWNYYWFKDGVRVFTHSADGGFEARAMSKAAVWESGTAMVQLNPGGYWALKFIEVVKDAAA